jgi:hypothetical protein
MSIKLFLALFGSVALGVGVFLPLFVIPRAGSVSMLGEMPVAGVIMVGLAAVAAFSGIMGRFRRVVSMGGLALLGCFLVYGLHSYQIVDLQAGQIVEPQSNPYIGLQDWQLAGISAGYGWYILAAGIVALLSVGLVRDPQAERKRLDSLYQSQRNTERIHDHFARADRLSTEGRHEEAIREYTEILSLNPRDGAMLARRGFSRLVIGQQKKGIEDLIQAARLGDVGARDYLDDQGVDWREDRTG